MLHTSSQSQPELRSFSPPIGLFESPLFFYVFMPHWWLFLSKCQVGARPCRAQDPEAVGEFISDRNARCRLWRCCRNHGPPNWGWTCFLVFKITYFVFVLYFFSCLVFVWFCVFAFAAFYCFCCFFAFGVFLCFCLICFSVYLLLLFKVLVPSGARPAPWNLH